MSFLGVITPKKDIEKPPPPSLPFGSAQREGGGRGVGDESARGLECTPAFRDSLGGRGYNHIMNDPLLPPRIQRLLERFPPTGKEKTWYPNGADERALLLREYFQPAGDEPLALRFAHGLAYVMEHIAIAIHEDELLVGEVGLEDVARHPSTRPGAGDGLLAAAQRTIFWPVFPGTPQKSRPGARPDLEMGQPGWACHPRFRRDSGAGPGRTARRGPAGRGRRPTLPPRTRSNRQVTWQALIAALEALSAYIRRYAALAGQMARSETRAGSHAWS